MHDKLLRLPDVAEMTGVSESTLRWYRQNGRGPHAAKLGRRLVYRESEVERWVNAQFDQTAP